MTTIENLKKEIEGKKVILEHLQVVRKSIIADIKIRLALIKANRENG